jgi:hypothetical protein
LIQDKRGGMGVVLGFVLVAMLATSLGLVVGGRLASGKVADAEARIVQLEAALALHDAPAAPPPATWQTMAARGVTEAGEDTSAMEAALRALTGARGR